ncbi:Apyrase [Ancylostoma caninum]|uniref:Apyrase n=1 Tax=Ancylostoma caninum TaxID=29170 RepID=A0A368GXB1_ANCCA|nr:Apyrase [Ancylostoma caninum]
MSALFVRSTILLVIGISFQESYSAPVDKAKEQIIPRTIHIVRDNPDGSRTYQLLAITDMDKSGRAEDWKWRAVARKGELTISKDRTKVTVKWIKDSDRNITSGFNYKGRGMELSDISEYDGRLLSPDDKTGMLYEIKDNKAVPWIFLNSGPGNSTSGMKVEWLTIKDGYLYAGGHGCEYRDRNTSKVVSEDPMWVKKISRKGVVTSLDWRSIFRSMRKKAGYDTPGYLTHEAVQWSDIQKKWFFLPRKASKTIYNEKEDEKKGTNLLITTPDLKTFNVIAIGEPDYPERGFSAFDFVPETEDKILVALKSVEVDDKTESYITVFDDDGIVLLKDQKLDDDLKFEGIYFI